MEKLFNKINYNGKLYEELTDAEGRKAIMDLVIKLTPLEKEIENDPRGFIFIRKSGSIYVTDFEADLSTKINKIIND